MSGRIVLYGASGYTGTRIAERLVAAGATPVLAGRDRERLQRLADRLDGDAEVVWADALRQNSVFSLVEEGDVLVSTVGPFVKYGDVAVRAAIAAGATYIDSTGEPRFIRRIFEEFGPLARGVQLSSLGTHLAQKLPGARPVMQGLGERVMSLLPGRSDTPGSSRLIATAHASDGRTLATTTLEGPDPYDFTASFMAWAAQRAAGAGVEGTGALSPVLAFGGLAGLHEGCAAAGIRERPAPVAV